MGKSNLRRDLGVALTWDELDDSRAPEINQTSHGLAVGDLVYRDSATSWAKAIATAIGTLAIGVVVDVEDANNLSVATLNGTWVTLTAHGFGAPPVSLYLSQGTAGDFTATKPTSGFIQRVGDVIDANTVCFRTGELAEFI